MADFIAVTKLNFNDHGEIHAKIAAASSLSMLDLLKKAGKKPDVITSGAGDWDDTFLVVCSAALLHDIGNQVHRVSHGDISPYLAVPILDRLLPLVYCGATSSAYSEMEKKTEIRGFILHAINTHDAEPQPLTIEAALVCISDVCDLTKGRGRLAFDLGNINIHTVSALSIDSVAILPGEQKPIKILVNMNNSAGIFQIEEALASKINAGPLADSVEMIATAHPRKAKVDKRIIFELEMKGRKFEPRRR
jgi:metal-dependent HD superfamily phosphatase/phosphodiesterase